MQNCCNDRRGPGSANPGSSRSEESAPLAVIGIEHGGEGAGFTATAAGGQKILITSCGTLILKMGALDPGCWLHSLTHRWSRGDVSPSCPK